MSGIWKYLTRHIGNEKWSFWRFNWIIHHRLIAALERTRPYARGILVDIGCGSMRGRLWYRGCFTRYVGVDFATSRYLDGARPGVIARGEALPFRDGSIDTVLAVSLLSYVAEPHRIIEEAHRILRPDGRLILEFTQTGLLHDEPYHYFRFTRRGARWLLERSGFEPLECVPIGGLMVGVGMTATAALNRINRGPTRVITEIPVRALYVVVQLGFALLDLLFFDPREVVGNLWVARKAEERSTESAGVAPEAAPARSGASRAPPMAESSGAPV